jgi:hypothetical protein
MRVYETKGIIERKCCLRRNGADATKYNKKNMHLATNLEAQHMWLVTMQSIARSARDHIKNGRDDVAWSMDERVALEQILLVIGKRRQKVRREEERDVQYQ